MSSQSVPNSQIQMGQLTKTSKTPNLEKRFFQLVSRRMSALSSRIDFLYQNRQLRRVRVSSAQTIPTWTTNHELKALAQLAANCPPGSFALEIGSYLGASACYLVSGLAEVGGHLYCVDTWQNEAMPNGERDTFAEFEKNTHNIRHWIIPVRKRVEHISHDDIKEPLSLAFIDGDHAYHAVSSDFAVVKKLLAADGTIAFHDCVTHEGVSRVVGEALGSGEWRIEGMVGNLLWMKRAAWTE